jgi:hypothetical protein
MLKNERKSILFIKKPILCNVFKYKIFTFVALNLIKDMQLIHLFEKYRSQFIN